MVKAFVDREVRPVAMEYELEDRYPTPIVEKMRALGFFGFTIPEQYGGSGLDEVCYAILMEELSDGWMSLAGILGTHMMTAWMILHFGTDAQRETYLPQMATGAWHAGILMIMSALEGGRINVAARSVGLARAAFEDSIRYAQQRETFGKPIAQHQLIQAKLADMATRIEASKLLTYQAAALKSAGRRCDLEAGMAKLFASETAEFCASEAMQIHGGMGYIQELPVERYFRDSKLLTVGEGPNEIQRLIIARRLLERFPV